MPADAFTIPDGQSRRKVRDFLRREVLSHFTRDAIVEWFGADITEALMDKALIEPARKTHHTRDEEIDGDVIPGFYRVAETGRRFSSKLLMRPISRAKADALLADLLKRARAVNRNPDFLYYVREINVIGSYLTDAQLLGDVDVEITIDRKIARYETFKRAAIARARMLAPFRYFYLASDEQSFCRREVFRFLKNRQPYLSVLSIRVDTPHRRKIFSDPKLDKRIWGKHSDKKTPQQQVSLQHADQARQAHQHADT
jgi:hypothetical protein